MIIVDTNVLSEAMRPRPAPEVMAWLAGQDPDRLFTTAITGAEIRYGILTMPEGKKRTALEHVADAILRRDFAGRVLPFDESAALQYAQLAARPEAAKDDASVFDAMIGAIAIANSAPVATRNVRHFLPFGLVVINPWDHPAP
ncbi:type II toxin-antitoxin system VapC family toxin [Methylopila sp. M107]|uniref:type II toxin-antitoxin system VapC family toxin n=1 Tax=Methylopila sp. M107 TaxID=1101190 RepID=UPI0003691396|nr:type II toxin-antitoxin system VapC family toxin [Methylopila sp. M107]